MFRFTIRDLLWLTLVVALGLGWFGRECYVESSLRSARSEAREWRDIAEALENTLETDGWAVERRGLFLHVYPLSDQRINWDWGFQGYRFDIDTRQP